jgi:steroid delta-isomerase
MADPTTLRNALDAYVESFNDRDRARWVGLFAADAHQEDPVGSPVNVGHDAIGTFFDAMEGMGQITISQTRPPIVAETEALLFLTAVTRTNGLVVTVPFIVDHIEFDEGGHMSSLRSFWDTDAIETASE